MPSSRPASRNSIEIFLKPDLETLANLEIGLAHLRGEANNKNKDGTTTQPQQQPQSDQAFQVATLLLSHSRIDFIREGIDLMERLTFRAFEEYRASSRALQILVNNSNSSNNSQFSDNKQAEEFLQQQKQQPTDKDDDNKTNKQRETLEKEKAKARDLLMSGYFLLAIGQYKLSEYTNARNCVERVLEFESHHPQAVALRDKIDEELMKNAAIGAGVVAIGAIGVAALLKGIFGK